MKNGCQGLLLDGGCSSGFYCQEVQLSFVGRQILEQFANKGFHKNAVFFVEEKALLVVFFTLCEF